MTTLGSLIRIARVQRGWTQKHLGGVAGASERTITLLERGDPAVAAGNLFNAAVAVGVPLFQIDDPAELAKMRQRGQEMVALIPKRVVEPESISDELRDF
ncbi:helix-turn-helix transcriptional regulator [Lysinibacter cavernae]